MIFIKNGKKCFQNTYKLIKIDQKFFSVTFSLIKFPYQNYY